MSINLASYFSHSLGDLIYFCVFKYHFYADDSQVYYIFSHFTFRFHTYI